MYEKTLELIKWWASHLLFTIVVNLCLFGGYHAHAWYQEQQPYKLDVTQLDDATLNQLSKEAFLVQQERRKENK